MRKLTYYAVFEPSVNTGFSVYFPDVKGCTSYGKTYVEALKMAQEALGYHLYEMENDGEELPEANPPEKIQIYPETNGGYLLSAVTVYPDMVKNELDNRAVRTNITLPSWLKELAEERHVNYSQLLTTALKEYLEIA